MTLRELLDEAYYAQQNYEKKNFISLKAAREIVTKDRVDEWSKSHALGLEHEHEKTNLIDRILRSSTLFFVVLVFAELEFLTKKLIANNARDVQLFDTKNFEHLCDSARLSSKQKERLAACRRYVGVIFACPGPQDVPEEAILPFLERERLEKWGSYGVIYRLKVPGLCLRGFDDTVVVAEKRIRRSTDDSEEDWEKSFREVKTLRKRGNHPNIITLLASYTMDASESGYRVKALHLLFPLAEMDLADWMTKPQPPDNVAGLSKEGRQIYIYRSMYELVSGVSYLHRDVDGQVTAHHDLKPRNILLVGDKMMIGDFGHSHLRPILEGSATDRASGLGTYEYQPPEYYNEDGTRAQVKHGRVFDVWAMGCIMIELATLAIHGWDSESVREFRQKRKRNPSTDRKVPESVQDDSFHNNKSVVKDWVGRLKENNGSQQLNEVLDIASGMLAPNPKTRPYMWEVQIDLYEALAPYVNNLPELEGDLLVAPEFEYRQVRENRRYRVSHYPAPNIDEAAETPLHRAARKNNKRRTIRLWELGWPVFLPDGNGDNPLDIMRKSNNVELETLEDDVNTMLEAAKAGKIEEIRRLFSRGLTPLLSYGVSAMSLAMEYHQLEVVDFLLENKAQEQLMLWKKGPEGPELPLHTAARLGFVEALHRILKYYPDINICEDNQTALWHGARRHPDVVKLLIANKAKLLPSKKLHMTPLHLATSATIPLLLEASDAPSCIESKMTGMTPLIWHAYGGNTPCCKILLQAGTSVHTDSPFGRSLLPLLAEYGLHELLRLCIEEFSLEKLECRNNGYTPVEKALMQGHKEVAWLLKSQIRQRRNGGRGPGGDGSVMNWIRKLDLRR